MPRQVSSTLINVKKVTTFKWSIKSYNTQVKVFLKITALKYSEKKIWNLNEHHTKIIIIAMSLSPFFHLPPSFTVEHPSQLRLRPSLTYLPVTSIPLAKSPIVHLCSSLKSANIHGGRESPIGRDHCQLACHLSPDEVESGPVDTGSRVFRLKRLREIRLMGSARHYKFERGSHSCNWCRLGPQGCVWWSRHGSVLQRRSWAGRLPSPARGQSMFMRARAKLKGGKKAKRGKREKEGTNRNNWSEWYICTTFLSKYEGVTLPKLEDAEYKRSQVGVWQLLPT